MAQAAQASRLIEHEKRKKKKKEVLRLLCTPMGISRHCLKLFVSYYISFQCTGLAYQHCPSHEMMLQQPFNLHESTETFSKQTFDTRIHEYREFFGEECDQVGGFFINILHKQ